MNQETSHDAPDTQQARAANRSQPSCLGSGYRDCAAHNYTEQAGRPPRGAVLLICQPSREAEWRFCGVGRPAWMPGEPRWAMDGPWRRAHGAEPERGNLSAAKAVRWGESALVTLPLCKVTRCKSETNIPVSHKCRICTRRISYLQLNNAPVANQARAALVRYQRV